MALSPQAARLDGRVAVETAGYAAAGVDRLLVSPRRRSADAVDALRRWAPLLEEAAT